MLRHDFSRLNAPCRCRVYFLTVVVLLSAFYATNYRARAFGPDDVGMFPPTVPARPYINFDGRGFIIHGRRIFIASGSMHYARVPRALWAGRLLKMKRAGFNTVETYIFWSYQEPRAGQFDFKGRHNLAAFLNLVHKLGLYAILRVGPYCDGEWSQGGWPVWLRFIPGLAVRRADKPFLNAVNGYFNKLLPIVAAHQINHGGAVIMVQLENEDSQGWGNVIPNGYYKFLYAKARAMGIDVPMFFSGMHHGTNAAGAGPWSTRHRTCPWLTTEMHTGWFNLYRTHPPWLSRLTHQAMWQVIAYGGNGYDAYLAVGGTTPSFYVNGPVGPSYDFCAPIGQAGDLRPLYYIYKTANYFA
jgi:beta-galactosidase